MKRPSYRELNGKIRQASEAVSQGYINILEQVNIAEDASELGYRVADISDVLSDVLNEITPLDYVGKKPPERSYEDKIQDCELFAFRWKSQRFGCEVYLKFTLKDEVMWLVSFHVHREI